jgi:hypothetical protein
LEGLRRLRRTLPAGSNSRSTTRDDRLYFLTKSAGVTREATRGPTCIHDITPKPQTPSPQTHQTKALFTPNPNLQAPKPTKQKPFPPQTPICKPPNPSRKTHFFRANHFLQITPFFLRRPLVPALTFSTLKTGSDPLYRWHHDHGCPSGWVPLSDPGPDGHIPSR